MKTKVWGLLSLLIVAFALPSCSINPLKGGFVLPDRGELNYDWDSYPVITSTRK